MAFGLLLTSAVFTLMPEELIFVTLGFLAHFGRVHPVEAIAAAHLGLIPADAITVWFGRKLGKNVLTRRPFRFFFGSMQLQSSLEKLRTSSGLLLFFTRFTPMLRAPVYLAAGISGISLRRSVAIDLLAASIQVPVFFLLGFFLGDSVSHFMALYTYLAPIALAFVLLAKAGKACLRSRRQAPAFEGSALERAATLRLLPSPADFGPPRRRRLALASAGSSDCARNIS